MPKLISVGKAVPEFEIPQAEVKEFISGFFAESVPEINRLIGIFDNSNISRRHFSVPLEWLKEPHSFAERNELYKNVSVKIAKQAIDECLEKANVGYADIDHIIFVSSTGLTTPTLDAILFNELNLTPHLDRSPIWGLGCLGGAVGLTRAFEYTKAFPERNALVLAVELCSLTFQKDDVSKSNVVASSLFSDGAAAVLVVGEKNGAGSNGSISLIDSLSTTFYDTLDVMGWEFIDEGFKVLFSRDIPSIVRELVRPNIDEFLNGNGLKLENIKHYMTHPGGLKVINAYTESLALSNGALDYARKVLRDYGNMSSVSVLFVIDEFLREKKFSPNEYGIISALGPGFSSELLLFSTQ